MCSVILEEDALSLNNNNRGSRWNTKYMLTMKHNNSSTSRTSDSRKQDTFSTLFRTKSKVVMKMIYHKKNTQIIVLRNPNVLYGTGEFSPRRNVDAILNIPEIIRMQLYLLRTYNGPAMRYRYDTADNSICLFVYLFIHSFMNAYPG